MLRFVALILTLLTGFTGLVYEVTWHKYLGTLLGSHAAATAALLGIFLGGLSVGYALFGTVAQRLIASGRGDRTLRVYGIVEIAIGVYAFLFPFLFTGASWLSVQLPLGSTGVAFGVDVFLTVLLIGPPTVLMGGTIPLLTQALSSTLQDATRIHAHIYAFNTVGAFLGALAGGFWLIPWLGLDGVLASMGFINVAAGAVFVSMRTAGSGSVPAADEPATEPRGSALLLYGCVALLSGFAMMTLQTILNRIGGLAFGSSHFTFAMVVSAFVLCLALGSFAVAALRRVPPMLVVGSQWLLVLSLLLLYARLPDATFYAHVIRSWFSNDVSDFYPYHLASLGAALTILVVPIGLSGALLPLLFHQARRELGDLGSVAGRLYSWNTVGSLLGALLGGYVLLLWLDLDQVFTVALVALALAASILTRLALPRASIALIAGLAAISVVAIGLQPRWDPARLNAGLFRQHGKNAPKIGEIDALFERASRIPVIFHRDDPVATVAVREGKRLGKYPDRSIVTNGKSDGNLISDYKTMAFAGLLPALMAEEVRRSFVIGLGTGVTAGELAALDSSEEVLVAEISPAVIEAAPLFDQGNLFVTQNPKVKMLRGDAYRTLLRSDGLFDVVVSEPSNPWVTGVEMLFSIEFLSAARDRLTDRGVYAQWFHLYETDAEVVDLIYRNYLNVFDDVAVFFTANSDFILLGFRDAAFALDLDRLASRMTQSDFAAALERVGVNSLAALVAHELVPVGTLTRDRVGEPLHTLRHPTLSDRAARAFFAGRYVDLPKVSSSEGARDGTRNSLLRGLASAEDARLPEPVLRDAAVVSCRSRLQNQCATLLARWRLDYPGSPMLANTLRVLRGGRERPPLADERLRLLGTFFEATPDAGPERDRLILRHYHHAAPFSWSHVGRALERTRR